MAAEMVAGANGIAMATWFGAAGTAGACTRAQWNSFVDAV